MIWQIWESWNGVWLAPWTVAISVFMFFFICQGIQWRVKLLPIALCYIVFSSTISFLPENFAFAPSTLGALLSFCAFLFFLALPPSRRFGEMIYFMGLIGAMCSALVLLVHEMLEMPLFWNRSMGGSFVVLALVTTPLWWAAVASALVLARSTPFLVLAVYYCARANTVVRTLIFFVTACIFMFYRGVPTGTGRYDFWRLYWNYWVRLPSFDKLVGTHFGMTAVQLPAQMLLYSNGNQVFVWLHNDLFQALTEFGIIGFTLCLAAFIEIFRKCDRQEKAMGLALVAAMTTNYPWHWMPEAFLYWFWIKKTAVQGGV